MTAVPRLETTTRQRFQRDYLLPNRPVVIADGLRDWPATKRWSPAYFLERLGDVSLPISGDFFHPEQQLGLATFIKLLEDFATKRSDELDVHQSVPYLRLPCPVSASEDDRRRVFAFFRNDWSRPYFLPTHFYVSPFELRGRQPNEHPYSDQGILLSARGACTGLHLDRTNDAALVCQVYGRKAAFLLPPSARSLDLVDADHTRRLAGTLPPKTRSAKALLDGELPEYEGTEAHYAELRAGDVLYIPKRWPHEVFTLETSVSLTYNFMHLADVDWGYIKYRWRGSIKKFEALWGTGPTSRRRRASPEA